MSRDGDRGQLLLVAAIVIAVTVLGGVVLLNTVHSSPDLTAQTDAQSVDDTERTTRQVQSNLRNLFVASGFDVTNERLPYAEEPALRDAVEQYSQEYTRVLSTNQSAVVAVEYDSAASATGAVAYGDRSYSGVLNNSDPNATSGKWIVKDADELPRMQFRFDDIDTNEELTVQINATSPSPDIEFTVDDSGVTGDITCNTPGGDRPVAIDLVYGAGEVTTEDGYCAVAVDESDWDLSEYNVRFTLTGVASDYPDGWYAVSTEGTSTICADPCETGGVVNPAFDVTYQDPNAAYSSQITLYERDDR